MSFDELVTVLKPKVDGSVYLDELFSENTLDFFVFFSSISAVTGNAGQANYGAANSFMCSMAAHRRNRGLAASVINIGVIIGVGYVTREVTTSGLNHLHKNGYMWMSESDFHQTFAEAILAGRPESGLTPEITTGLRLIKSDESHLPIWYDNPVFQKQILKSRDVELEDNTVKSTVPIKLQLMEVTNVSQLHEIIKG